MYFMRNFGGSVVKKPMCNSKKHCIIDKFPTKIGRIFIFFLVYLWRVKEEKVIFMKFGDKLSELRKSKGLSQEALADKLGVTRQTVSKWELSQTKPDTDMLLKISEVLEADVSSLIDNNETSVKKSDKKADIDETKPRTWLLIVLIVLALIIAVVLINKVVIDKKAKTGDKSWGIFEVFKGFIGNIDKEEFNGQFEMYSGTEMGASTKKIIDNVIKNNKTNKDRLVTFVYNDVKSTDPDEIKGVKSKINDFKDYEVSLDYDDDGYVNKVTVEDVKEENMLEQAESMVNNITNDSIDRDAFNGPLSVYEGERMGGFLRSALDNVAGSNQDNPNHLITVVFGDTTVTDPNSIRNMKSNLNEWTTYNVTFDYDDNGYINKMTITN